MADLSPGRGLHPLEQDEVRRRALPALLAELMNTREPELRLTAADVLGDVALLLAAPAEERGALLREWGPGSPTQAERMLWERREAGVPVRLAQRQLQEALNRKFESDRLTFTAPFCAVADECDWDLRKAGNALAFLLDVATRGERLPLEQAGLLVTYRAPIEGLFTVDGEPVLGWGWLDSWSLERAAEHPLMSEWEAHGRSFAHHAAGLAEQAPPAPAAVLPPTAPAAAAAEESLSPEGDKRRCLGHPGWLEPDLAADVPYCKACRDAARDKAALETFERVYRLWRCAARKIEGGGTPTANAVFELGQGLERPQPTHRTVRRWFDRWKNDLRRWDTLPFEERERLTQD